MIPERSGDLRQLLMKLCKHGLLPCGEFDRLLELSHRADRVEHGGARAWLNKLLLVASCPSGSNRAFVSKVGDDLLAFLRQIAHPSPLHCWIPPQLVSCMLQIVEQYLF